MNTLPGKFLNFIILFASTLLLIVRIPYHGTDKKLDLSDMALTLCDEFDGDKLNSALWNDFPNGVRKGGYWSQEQAFVRDGNLIIRTEYKQDGGYGPGYYTMGIRTKGAFQQQYGYFECRCILPPAQGLWSAFWLFYPSVSSVTGTGETGTEIDIFESPYYYLGNRCRNKITTNLHYNDYELDTKYQNVGIYAVKGDPYKEYNTYGLKWDENEYIFYINGVETGRSKFGGVSKVPEYLKLSVEVDGSDATPNYGWSGRIDKNGKDKLPVDFVVDYVKVYQYNKYMQQ